MRGIGGKNFKNLVQTAVNRIPMALVGAMRKSLASGIQNDFRKLAEKFNTIDFDLEKTLISIDGGPFKTPEQCNIELGLGLIKMQIVLAGLEMYKEMGRKKIHVKLQKPDMPETIIQFDNGKEWSIKEVIKDRMNDPMDKKAKVLALNVGKTEWSKEIVLKK